jgi:hypothetical protein
MSLQASGQISASQIRNEFGATSGTSVRFGAYRVSQTVSALTNMPLDAGIPQSGSIRFSNFYSKKLNVVVDYTSSTPVTKVNAKNDYDANSRVVVVGGFKQRPADPAGTKVWIHTNGDIGSDAKSTTKERCSLITGAWSSTTDLRLDIGPNGRVVGAGGDGGDGGYEFGSQRGCQVFPGNPGSNGTSAIGITTPNIIVTNRGIIQAGGGGGGGGGAAAAINQNTGDPDEVHGSGGGGGGGGIGYPGGTGGTGGTSTPSGNGRLTPRPGTNGTSGTISSSGNGGAGGSFGIEGQSGASLGGGGGGGGTSGLGGDTPNGTNDGTAGTIIRGGTGANGIARGFGSGGTSKTAVGAAGGDSGYAIIVIGSGTGVTITNTGTIKGITIYSTTPS